MRVGPIILKTRRRANAASVLLPRDPNTNHTYIGHSNCYPNLSPEPISESQSRYPKLPIPQLQSNILSRVARLPWQGLSSLLLSSDASNKKVHLGMWGAVLRFTV